MYTYHLVCLVYLAALAASQYFPPTPEGLSKLQSKFHPGVTISFKEPGICETSAGVKSYSGYIQLPPEFLDRESQHYPINTFFWFFESRIDPANAPLTIWMNGGPGGSSLVGALQENGPCLIGNDSNSTYINPYSWNNEVNMLYIDQPVQVGYSYDVPTNVTVSARSGSIVAQDFSHGVPEQNNTFLVGTLASQNPTFTANATKRAAHAMWHFAQIWFEEFPHYKPLNEKISIWTESYGGIYGPAFAALFEEQNQKIENGAIKSPGAHYIHLDTLGIINGCVDFLVQYPSGPRFSYNNTYNIQAINQTVYEKAMHEWDKPNGVKDSILDCRAAAEDPEADTAKSDSICAMAIEYGGLEMEGAFVNFSGRARFDITHPQQDPFPPPYFLGFLNQHWVQKALGVPVNYTVEASVVYEGFVKTGDLVRAGAIAELEYVLDSAIKVALVYGDRDYACNWIGGEEISQRINHTSSDKFAAAGYTPIQVDESYVGGQVRQHGNLSFSRVYQAGHEVPAYQSETAYEIFMRTLFNKDVATGTIDTFDDYSTVGPSTTWHIKNEVFPAPEPVCYILQAGGTCTEDQWARVENGTAIVENYVVVGYSDGERQNPISTDEARVAQDSVQEALKGSVSGDARTRGSNAVGVSGAQKTIKTWKLAVETVEGTISAIRSLSGFMGEH